MTEIAKVVEAKKEAPLVELIATAKPVVEKPKAKEAKPAVKAKPAAAISASLDDEVSYEPDLADNERQAHFRDPARDYPLKDVDIHSLRAKLHRQVYPSRRGREQELNYTQTFKHVIVRNTLYVLDNRSGITLSEQMWLNEGNPFSYLNDDMSNLPTDIVVLENSTILAAYTSINGENLLRSATLKAAYNISLTKSTVVYSNARAISSMTLNDSTIRSSSLTAESLRLNNLDVSEYYINATGTIRLDDIRFGGASELRIYGENIKDVEISRNGRIHSGNSRSRFDYYGEKPISIVSTRRVDNGFFMGSTPLPFIKTDAGLLVGGAVFTYTDFKQFIETTLDKLQPPKQTDGNYQSFRPLPPLSFGYPGSVAASVQANVPGEILNSLYQLIRNNGDCIKYQGQHTSEKYTEVDSLLTLTNEQIAVLAGQISSRLRLFKELDALI